MTLRHAWLLTFALAAAAAQPAFAQGFGPPAGGAGGAQQEPPCMKDFMPLRSEAEKRAKAVQAAGKQASPQQACELIGRFVEAEAKVVAFAEREGAWCGIPPQAVATMKENHGKSQAVRKRVCQVAANGGGAVAAPRGPSFSDALGTTRVPDANTVRSGTGAGTFDTMTGNALKR
jgi:hypothetical protein